MKRRQGLRFDRRAIRCLLSSASKRVASKAGKSPMDSKLVLGHVQSTVLLAISSYMGSPPAAKNDLLRYCEQIIQSRPVSGLASPGWPVCLF